MIASCDTHRIPGKVEDIAAKMETLMDVASRDDEHLLSGPQGIGEGLKQDEVGRMLTGRAGPEGAPGALSQLPGGRVRGAGPSDLHGTRTRQACHAIRIADFPSVIPMV